MLIYANLRLIYKNNGKIYDVGYGQIQVVLDLATEVTTKITPFDQINTIQPTGSYLSFFFVAFLVTVFIQDYGKLLNIG